MENEIAVNAFVTKWSEVANELKVPTPMSVLKDCEWLMESVAEMEDVIFRVESEQHRVGEEVFSSAFPRHAVCLRLLIGGFADVHCGSTS